MIVKKRRILQDGGTSSDLHDQSKERLRFEARSCYIPKNDVKKPRGEDAHFICQERKTIGVADGVGGWAKKGVDSGIYARELMKNSVAALQLEPPGGVNPKRVLLLAHSKTTAKGSSTACIVTLRGDRLFYANVGDSGFMVFRDNQLVYESPTQQRYFNCPCQLRSGGRDVNEVYEGEVRVEAGDIVVAGTDGLLDNLFSDEIEDVLQETQGRPRPEQIAWTIAGTASANSQDQDYYSPFAIAAESAGFEHTGGKYDDITVVVAQIETVR